MKVLARHYLCFAGQLCGVSTDGTGFTAFVLHLCPCHGCYPCHCSLR